MHTLLSFCRKAISSSRTWVDFCKTRKGRHLLKIKLSSSNYWKILKLKNAHAGKQCVVVLGGPSVDEVDFDLFADHPFVMGVNGAYLKRNDFKYYFCSSLNFYKPNKENIRKVQATYFFFSDVIPFRRERNSIYIALDLKRPIWKQSEKELNFNLLKTIPWGPTVFLDLVIPVCLWMGFSEIILIGADYSRKDYKRFYDNRNNAPRHTHKSDNESEMVLAHRSIDRLVAYLETRDMRIKIHNCSPLSELTQFEKASLEEVLNNEGVPLNNK